MLRQPVGWIGSLPRCSPAPLYSRAREERECDERSMRGGRDRQRATTDDVRQRRSRDPRRDPGRGHRRPADPRKATRGGRASAARERRAKFRLIADRAPVMIWTARPDATLDYVNGTCAEFTGLPMREVAGRGLVGRRPSGRPGPLHRHLRSGVRGTDALPPGVPARRADGVYRWLLAPGVPKYASGRQFCGLRRLRHRHHRTQECRRPDSREPGRSRGEPSRDPAPGRPADRGPGCRAGAHRARSARRREPAAGRVVDRLERPQASHGRIARSATACRRICGRSTSARPRSRRTSVTSPTTCIPPCCDTPGWWPH